MSALQTGANAGRTAREAAKDAARKAELVEREAAFVARLRVQPQDLGMDARVDRILAGGTPAAAKAGVRPSSRLELICERLDTLADDVAIAAVSRDGANSPAGDLSKLVSEFQALATEVRELRKPADRARAWRNRQTKRGHKRTDWIWAAEGVRTNGGMDRNQRARLIARAKWWNLLRRSKGQHKGPLRGTGIEVYEALLFHFFNMKTGDCFPSLMAIAQSIGRSESVVAKAIQRLANAKLLFIIPRRDRGIRRDGRKLPIVTSNAYVFPPITENNRGTAVRGSFPWPVVKNDAASPWSGDLRSPAATAQAAQYGPDGQQMPY